MSDLISRSALLEEFEWLKITVGSGSVGDIKDAIERIKNAPAVDAMPKWISVKAGLPKAFKDVDIAFGNADSIGFYSNVSKRWYLTKGGNGVPVHGVHHWKYRDEPPKEDT